MSEVTERRLKECLSWALARLQFDAPNTEASDPMLLEARELLANESPFPEPTRVEFVGPFGRGTMHRITVDGFRVPYLELYREIGGERDGEASLMLDDRFGWDFPDEEIKRWIPLVAEAMAIAAGYSCFGKMSHTSNPFRTRMIAITSATTE